MKSESEAGNEKEGKKNCQRLSVWRRSVLWFSLQLLLTLRVSYNQPQAIHTHSRSCGQSRHQLMEHKVVL